MKRKAPQSPPPALRADQDSSEAALSNRPGYGARLKSAFAGPRVATVLCHIDLIQDLDILLPVLISARDEKRLRLRVTVARWLAAASPRVAKALKLHQIAFRYVSRNEVGAGRQPSLRGVDAVLTASESDQPTHTAGHALALRANALGITTFTIQHGLDSLAGSVRFASNSIFGWHRPGHMPDGVSDETLQKVLPVGRPMLALPRTDVDYDIGVFENLHAGGYSETIRAAFVDTLESVLTLRPDVSFLVRPHPAGRWLDDHHQRLSQHRNAIFDLEASASSRIDPGYFDVARCGRVITTPSTIALDAAMTGRAVALTTQASGPYAKMTVLSDLQSWLGFIDGSITAPDSLDLVKGILTEGTPVGRVIHHLLHTPGSPKAIRPKPGFET